MKKGILMFTTGIYLVVTMCKALFQVLGLWEKNILFSKDIDLNEGREIRNKYMHNMSAVLGTIKKMNLNKGNGE